MSDGLVDRLGRRPIPFRKSTPSRLALTEGVKLEELLSLLAGEPTGLTVGSGCLVMAEEESMSDSETPTALLLTDPRSSSRPLLLPDRQRLAVLTRR